MAVGLGIRRWLVAVALVFGMSAQAWAQAPASPTARVEALHEALITVMQGADTMAYGARRDLLAPVIENGFDSAFMARVAAGSYWRGMTDDQRQALINQFRAFTIANYAARFNGYSGQQFETLNIAELPGGRVMVRTHLNRAKDDPVGLDYVLRPSDAGFQIIDIFMNGTVSELATRRSEFAPVLRDHGAAGLIESLAEKTAELEAGETGDDK
ncbi:MAG: hypothetical protein Tsb0016_25900 [Sphingomonadales bacterium]